MMQLTPEVVGRTLPDLHVHAAACLQRVILTGVRCWHSLVWCQSRPRPPGQVHQHPEGWQRARVAVAGVQQPTEGTDWANRLLQGLPAVVHT